MKFKAWPSRLPNSRGLRRGIGGMRMLVATTLLLGLQSAHADLIWGWDFIFQGEQGSATTFGTYITDDTPFNMNGGFKVKSISGFFGDEKILGLASDPYADQLIYPNNSIIYSTYGVSFLAGNEGIVHTVAYDSRYKVYQLIISDSNPGTLSQVIWPSIQLVGPVPVPGPLPILGALAAFGWSRRLRSKIRAAREASGEHAPRLDAGGGAGRTQRN